MQGVVDGQTLAGRAEAGNAFHFLRQLAVDVDRATMPVGRELDAGPGHAAKLADQACKGGQGPTDLPARDGRNGWKTSRCT